MALVRGIRNRAGFLLFALAVPATAFVPLVAFGEPKPHAAKPAKESDPADKYDPDNITAISQFMETIAKGNERFAAKDQTGAIDTYKKAIQLSPRNPLGHYLLAEAYLAAGNVPEAEAAIQMAYEGDSKNAAVRAHVLFVRADIFERQKKWEEAKAAWQAYIEHAAKLSDAGGYPQTGAERVKALQKVVDLETAYAAVRERIAAEKADAGKDAGKGAPAPK